MTEVNIPIISISLQALSLDVVRSCVPLQPEPVVDPGQEPPGPVEDGGLYLPVAPGISYENLPIIDSIVDTAPDQIIGCIVSVADNPQGRLNALFPSAESQDGVIDRSTNDIWIFDGTEWDNAGPNPGQTLTVSSVIPPWNEIFLSIARTRTKIVAESLPYALQLLTDLGSIITTTSISVQSSRAIVKVPVAALDVAASAPSVSVVSLIQSSIVNSLTYAGTGASQVVETPYVDPSLIFIRDYNQSFTDIYVFDKVRGATKYWRPSDAAQPESTDAQTLTAFGNASFTVGTSNLVNASGETYLVWAFGGTAPAVNNTDGTLQSTVAVSDVFSIATYTGNGVAGATFGHGMAGTPDAVLVKRMSSVVNARGLMGGPTLGTNVNVEFGVPEAKTTDSNLIRSAGATTVALGSASSVNGNGAVYAAYSFRSVAGKSKIGTYTGDGVGTGQYIECDFLVDFVIVKAIDTYSGYWFIFNRTFEGDGDIWTALDQFPPYQESNVMYGIEGTGFRVFIGDDFDLYDDLNANGETYFYMAFAAVRPNAYVDTTVDIGLQPQVPSISAN